MQHTRHVQVSTNTNSKRHRCEYLVQFHKCHSVVPSRTLGVAALYACLPACCNYGPSQLFIALGTQSSLISSTKELGSCSLTAITESPHYQSPVCCNCRSLYPPPNKFPAFLRTQPSLATSPSFSFSFDGLYSPSFQYKANKPQKSGQTPL